MSRERIRPATYGAPSYLRSDNGIRERFHRTVHDEFYRVAFRKKIYEDLESLQRDLDEWMHYYNYGRRIREIMCCGRTPMEVWQEKKLN